MKKLVSCLMALLLVFGTFSMLLAHQTPKAMAATVPTGLHIPENEAAGLPNTLLPSHIAGVRYGFFLPGSADPSQLKLCWPDTRTVKDVSGNVLTSGELSLSHAGNVLSLIVDGNTAVIYIYQGSKDVRAMFLETDTSLAGFSSFDAMHNDPNKEKEAAGTMTFGDDSGYYFSMKGRGNSNWYSAKKKPYNITLYKDNTYNKKLSAELIDGVEAKKWTLTASYYDDSLLRNKVGFDMAEALGIGLKSDFVDLYVDGRYLGSYLLTPKNDYQAPDNGFVVEIDNWLDDEDHQFTLDGMKEYHATIDGSQHRITLKDNGAKLPNEQIESYMQQAWNALLDEKSDEYLKYIDLDSWAKYYLLHEFYKSFDVVCGSIIMHRDGTADTDKLIAGPVWDLDNSMGRVQNNADLGLTQQEQHSPEGWYIQNIKDKEAYPGGEVVTHFWLQQLGKHDGFMERVYQLYWENKSVFDGAADSLSADITRLTASAEMNEVLPNTTSGRPAISGTDDCGCKTTNTWKDFAGNLLNFVTKRAAFLSDNIPAQSVPTPTTQPVTNTGLSFTPIFNSDPLIPWLILCGGALVAALIVVLVKHRKK